MRETTVLMENVLVNLVRQRLLVCFCFCLVALFGVFSFLSLPIDAFPDLTNNQVQILMDAPGMAPAEVEQLVTIPVEGGMSGIPKVQQVRSLSKYGLSIVTVVFDDEVNIYFARQLVNERLQLVQSRLPDNIRLQMGPVTTGMGEIYQYLVKGDGESLMTLKTLHDWDIKYQLRTIPGVNEVNTWGGETMEYVVTVDLQRLAQFQLSLSDVFDSINRNNTNFSGGIVTHGPEQWLVRGQGKVNDMEDIERILIKKHEGAPISLSQIANVSIEPAFRQGAVTADGKGEVVTGLVMMLKGENSRQVIERVKAKIADIQKSLPEGVKIVPFYDQTHLVEQTIETVRTNLLEGGLLVVLILFLMLGNLRAAIIVASVIPLSMMFSFMGMHWLGITANIMSLGAIDFGMIVDGAIVMVENTLHRLAGETKPGDPVPENPRSFMGRVVEQSLREMARPIFFGVLIISLVYVPILSLEGLEYKLFSPMVMTVFFALIGSLLTALILVPVLCVLWLKPSQKLQSNRFLSWVGPRYLARLQWAMSRPKQVIGIAFLLLVLTWSSLPLMGSEFVPVLDEGDMIIELRTLPSASLGQSMHLSTQVEKAIRDVPAVKTVVTKIGRPDLATDPMGVYQMDCYVILKPKSDWGFGVTKSHLIETFSKRIHERVSGLTVNFTQPIAMRVDELVSGVRSDVAVKLFGEDFKVLSNHAGDVAQVLSQISGVSDLQVEAHSGTNQVVVIPNRTKLAQYGLDVDDVRTVMQTTVLGTPVSEVLDGRKRFTLRVKLPAHSQDHPEWLADLLVETQTGERIPLSQVADIEDGEGMEMIPREFGQRRLIVQCNVRGRDLGSFVKEAQEKIQAQVAMPAGYNITWGGEFENQQRAMGKLLLVVPLSILVIFLLLVGTFSSVKHALLVLLNVPFASVGGILALWLRGMYLNVPASIGFIAVFGVAVLNGIVLVSTIQRQVRENPDLEGAIMEAARARLKPVLITAMVALFGFVPMAFSIGSGAEVQKPLATVVIGGIISSTLLTLFVLPVVYKRVNPDGAIPGDQS